MCGPTGPLRKPGPPGLTIQFAAISPPYGVCCVAGVFDVHGAPAEVVLGNRIRLAGGAQLTSANEVNHDDLGGARLPNASCNSSKLRYSI
jgi:hypothetical protein